MAEPGPLWRAAALAGVRHAFLGAGVAPDPALVAPGAALVGVRQVHSPLALGVEAPFAADSAPEADALATATPGLVLAIRTADCAPVLLADRQAGVVGAAHAGWRGALAGVIGATVAEMQRLGARPDRIAAAIGPTIAPASYEVDEAFRQRFLAADPGNGRFFSAGRAGRWQFDLPAYVAARLGEAGVGTVEDLGLDTYSGAQLHSHRRATHRGEADEGRQYSLIALG